jgi:hypothetical protein
MFIELNLSANLKTGIFRIIKVLYQIGAESLEFQFQLFSKIYLLSNARIFPIKYWVQ